MDGTEQLCVELCSRFQLVPPQSAALVDGHVSILLAVSYDAFAPLLVQVSQALRQLL